MNLKQELHPKTLLPAAMTGMTIGAIILPLLLSLAVLIYSGDLARFLPIGIRAILLGGIAFQIVVALMSSYRGMIGGPQDSPTAIMALAAVAISAAMAGAPAEARFATTFATIIITTVLVGIVFILIGIFKFSRIVRFIPYPVVGGFVAGTGLLLTRGAFGILMDHSTDMANFRELFMSGAVMRWLPGALFGVVLMLASRRSQHILVMPVALTLAAALFYGILFFTGTSLENARGMGLLLGPFPAGSFLKPLELSMFRGLDWGVIGSQITNIGAVVMISVVALLLNASALELTGREDLDMNRELIAAGIGNIAAAFSGSPAGYHYLGFSMIPLRSGVRYRGVGFFSALVFVVFLFFGASLLSLVPKFIVGGILLFVGLSFLGEWVYDAWFNLPKLDYALVLLILVVVGWAGFLEGVGVGILAAVLLFAVNYSRINIINDELTGKSFKSNMERPIEHYALLNALGGHIVILRLDGFIFFGTAQGLLDRIKERLKDPSLPVLRFLILDFRRVSSVDSSAVFSFIRIEQLMRANNVHLILSEISPQTIEGLKAGGVEESTDGFVHFFPNLDEGMEYCENKLIMEDASSALIRIASLEATYRKIFGSEANVEKFKHYLEREELDQYHILIKQGDESDAMYFVESGEVTARLEISRERFIRLRTVGSGTVVGEVGLYTDQKRSATIVITRKCVIYKLSRKAMERLEKEEPGLASSLHRWLVSLLSYRLADVNQTLQAMFN